MRIAFVSGQWPVLMSVERQAGLQSFVSGQWPVLMSVELASYGRRTTTHAQALSRDQSHDLSHPINFTNFIQLGLWYPSREQEIRQNNLRSSQVVLGLTQQHLEARGDRHLCAPTVWSHWLQESALRGQHRHREVPGSQMVVSYVIFQSWHWVSTGLTKIRLAGAGSS